MTGTDRCDQCKPYKHKIKTKALHKNCLDDFVKNKNGVCLHNKSSFLDVFKRKLNFYHLGVKLTFIVLLFKTASFLSEDNHHVSFSPSVCFVLLTSTGESI